jgi:hypothetical protein
MTDAKWKKLGRCIAHPLFIITVMIGGTVVGALLLANYTLSHPDPAPGSHRDIRPFATARIIERQYGINFQVPGRLPHQWVTHKERYCSFSKFTDVPPNQGNWARIVYDDTGGQAIQLHVHNLNEIQVDSTIASAD